MLIASFFSERLILFELHLLIEERLVILLLLLILVFPKCVFFNVLAHIFKRHLIIDVQQLWSLWCLWYLIQDRWKHGLSLWFCPFTLLLLIMEQVTHILTVHFIMVSQVTHTFDLAMFRKRIASIVVAKYAEFTFSSSVILRDNLVCNLTACINNILYFLMLTLRRECACSDSQSWSWLTLISYSWFRWASVNFLVTLGTHFIAVHYSLIPWTSFLYQFLWTLVSLQSCPALIVLQLYAKFF